MMTATKTMATIMVVVVQITLSDLHELDNCTVIPRLTSDPADEFFG